jgi:hypothetical protein
MLQLLKTNQPLAHILVPIIIGLGLLPNLFADLTPWSSGIIDLSIVGSLPQLAIYLIEFALLWIGALLCNRLFNNGHFTTQISNFPEFVFALIAVVAVAGKLAILPLLAINMVLLGLQSITKVYRQNNASSEYFSGALWFGIASIAWHSMIILLPFLIVCIIFTRAMNWREYIVAVVGYFLPYFWLLSVCYLLDTSYILQSTLSIYPGQFSEMLSLPFKWETIIFVGTMTLIILFGLRSFLSTYGQSTNQSKNTKNITLIALIAFTFVGLITPGNWILAADLPVLSLIIPFFFVKKKIGIGTRILFYLFLFSAFGKLAWPFVMDLVR